MEAQFPAIRQRRVGQKSVSRAHVEISTPFDLSTGDFRHDGASSKIFGDSELKELFLTVRYRQHHIPRPLVQLLPSQV